MVIYIIEFRYIGEDREFISNFANELGETNKIDGFSGGLIMDGDKPIGREGYIAIETDDTLELLKLEVEQAVHALREKRKMQSLDYIIKIDDGSVPEHYIPPRLRK